MELFEVEKILSAGAAATARTYGWKAEMANFRSNCDNVFVWGVAHCTPKRRLEVTAECPKHTIA